MFYRPVNRKVVLSGCDERLTCPPYTTFTKLGKDTISPFEDNRRNSAPEIPEVRIYRMRYLKGDDEVGNWSDEVKIVCLI
ncbi:MAG: hypothetical protein QME25_07655 [Bacteroidota bacterium]|nr:hypothetical protein [Bacteroidota bacterium]